MRDAAGTRVKTMTADKDTRIDARTLAVLIGDPIGTTPYALARKVNDKRVRSVARDTVDRFINRTGYTAHAYTPAEARAIVTAMAAAGRGAPTVNADAVRAAHKAATPRKARKASRKASGSVAAQSVAQDAPQTDGGEA